MSKELTPLIALTKLRNFYDLPNRDIVAYMLEQENLDEYVNIIEKALKALETIKKKQVNVYYFTRLISKTTSYKEYVRKVKDIIITLISVEDLSKDEFELLKETLLC